MQSLGVSASAIARAGSIDPALVRSRRATLACFACNGLLLSSWFSRIPALADRIGTSPGALGMVLFSLTFAALTAVPLAARALRSRPASELVTSCAVLSPVALFAAASATTRWQLALALVVFGLINGTVGVGINAHATHLARLADKPWMPAMYGAASTAGVLGAAGGTAATAAGIPLQLHLGTVCVVVLAVALVARRALPLPVPAARNVPAEPNAQPRPAARNIQPRPAARNTQPRPAARNVRTGRMDGTLMLLIGAALGATVTEGALVNFSIVVVHDLLHAGLATATAAFTVFAIALAGVRVGGGWLISRAGSLAVLGWGGLLATLSGVLLFGQPPVAGAFLALAGAAIGIGCTVPVCFQLATAHAHRQALIRHEDPTAGAARSLARISLAVSGGYLSGGPLLGLLASVTGLSAAVLLVPCGAAALTGCSAMLAVRGRDDSETSLTGFLGGGLTARNRELVSSRP